MWIAITEGWLSIVGHRDKPEHLLVRARNPEAIRRTFGKERMYYIGDADYPYRADIPRGEVAEFLTRRLTHMKYDNFKNTVGDWEYRDVLHSVWNRMYRYGEQYRKDGLGDDEE